MSFKQLRASLLQLPAIKDTFLHVHTEKAGDSKTKLNSVFFPASPTVFSILTAHKIATITVSVQRGQNDWQLPSADEKEANKG